MYSQKDVKETIITINDLLHADEIMLVNSVIGEVKVDSLYYENEFIEYK
jgi:branched-subunit amino acid aminotransferase/4-amino-4-deoxychorismate lyase